MTMTGSVRNDPVARAARARLAEAGAAGHAAVAIDRLRMAGRGSPGQARARQLAMYLANVVFGLNYTQVGLCFGRDRTTVRHACACVEERRDDPGLDRSLTALELGLRALEKRLFPPAARRGGRGR